MKHLDRCGNPFGDLPGGGSSPDEGATALPPRLAPGTDLRRAAELRRAAALLREPGAPLIPARTRRAPRGSPAQPTMQDIFGTTGSGLSGAQVPNDNDPMTPRAHIYLPENRFEWWQVRPDMPARGTGHVLATGPMTQVPGEPAALTFARHFWMSIAQVVGSDRDPLVPTPRARWVSWEGGVESPNALDGAGFAVRATPDGVAPRLHEETIVTDFSIGPFTVLRAFAADSGRAGSIWLDFITPQRVVGLEGGFLGNDHDEVAGHQFMLRAYDRDGGLLAESDGHYLQANLDVAGAPATVDWRANQTSRIGVNDNAGRIAAVEFACLDPNFRPDQSLFVVRVWSEPLPPAAVLQGVMWNAPPGAERSLGENALVNTPGLLHPNHPDLAAGHAFWSGATIRLPFLCNRAVAFLRGFGLSRREPRAVKVASLGVGLNLAATESPDVVTLSGWGQLWAAEAEDDATVAVLYFTLVAWNDAEIDAVAGNARASGELRRGDTDVTTLALRGANPHPPLPAAAAAGRAPVELFGPVFGAPRRLFIRLPRPCELQFLGVSLGATVEEVPGTVLRPTGLLFLPAPALKSGAVVIGGLGYSPDGREVVGAVDIDLHDTFDGDEQGHCELDVILVNGISVSATPGFSDSVRLALRRVGRRRDEPNPFPIASDAIPLEIDADVAAVALGLGWWQPEDEVVELDVEVRGDSFTNPALGLQLGGGVDIRGNGWEEHNPAPRLDVQGWPALLGLTRRVLRRRIAFATRTVRFRVAEGVTTDAEQVGALRNDSNVPVTIWRVLQYPDARGPRLVAEHRGQPVPVETISATRPLTLAPGEVLAIGGSFSMIDGLVDRWAWQGQGGVYRLACLTNVAEASAVYVPLDVTVTAGNPYGGLWPEVNDFGAVRAPVAHPLRRSMLVTSDGQTPLLITALRFEPQVIAFAAEPQPMAGVFGSGPQRSFAFNVQVDPGTSFYVDVLFMPPAAEDYATTLVAETNAGELRARITGRGVAN